MRKAPHERCAKTDGVSKEEGEDRWLKETHEIRKWMGKRRRKKCAIPKRKAKNVATEARCNDLSAQSRNTRRGTSRSESREKK